MPNKSKRYKDMVTEIYRAIEENEIVYYSNWQGGETDQMEIVNCDRTLVIGLKTVA